MHAPTQAAPGRSAAVGDAHVWNINSTAKGGGVAEMVGRRLQELGATRQVLCVTHLPQLASYGDLHFHVRKGISGDRTITRVKTLDRNEREEELAGMLGAITAQTRASAREMMKSSEAEKQRSEVGRGCL